MTNLIYKILSKVFVYLNFLDANHLENNWLISPIGIFWTLISQVKWDSKGIAKFGAKWKKRRLQWQYNDNSCVHLWQWFDALKDQICSNRWSEDIKTIIRLIIYWSQSWLYWSHTKQWAWRGRYVVFNQYFFDQYIRISFYMLEVIEGMKLMKIVNDNFIQMISW